MLRLPQLDFRKSSNHEREDGILLPKEQVK
jgi:hypothetical protein